MSKYSLRGAEMLGITLHPHQIALGDLLDRGIETTSICWGRRNGKTEAVWAWMLGLMDLEDDTYIVITAQTGSKSRDRFMSHARRLDRFYPEDAGGPKIRRGAIVDMDFANGSRMWSVAPHEDSYRGDEARVAFIDEAQSFDPEQGANLKQGIMPILDTVADGQVILAGTPGDSRAGWFWDALQAGLSEQPGHATSMYTAGDDIADIDLDDEEMWQCVLPGIGTLTTLEKMRARRAGLDDATWAQEYLGVWPRGAFSGAFDIAAWNECADEFSEKPSEFVLAFDAQPESKSSSVVAAWRDGDQLRVELLAQRPNTDWTPKFLYDLLLRYPKARVVYDGLAKSAMTQPTEVLKRQKKIANRVVAHDSRAVMAGQDNIVKAVDSRSLRYPKSNVGLTNAVMGAQWRSDPEGKGRYLNWHRSDGDISPIRAAALAVWELEQNPRQKPIILDNA
ncbi:hypothetical protein IU11_13985 [Cellulosimicrobium sp. MM]|nr:hypothetical protein IU11_13985 [Cellulosimicrobium sp. MM]